MLKPLLKKVYQKNFSFWERLGIHVTPNHYYFPIPDTRSLDEDLWRRRSTLVGLDVRSERFLELLDVFTRYRAEYETFPREKPASAHEYFVENENFASVDGEVLFCMIRHFKPAKIIEIGSGFSTFLSARAVRENRAENPSHACELIAIEPHPTAMLRRGFPGLSRLVPTVLQQVPLKEFEALGENDILFIDSSHVIRTGNDVQMEYLEILPRLAKGVLVQIHDIYLPAEYPRDYLKTERLFYNEQYLLQAFLAFNDRFEVLWGSSFMHLDHPEILAAAFPSYRRDGDWWPRSLWMRRVK